MDKTRFSDALHWHRSFELPDWLLKTRIPPKKISYTPPKISYPQCGPRVYEFELAGWLLEHVHTYIWSDVYYSEWHPANSDCGRRIGTKKEKTYLIKT